jgi:hypothetical protein
MKTAKDLFLLIFFALLVNSCNKDYPKDIPKWLEKKIKYCDKRKNDCQMLIIDEYSYQGEIYYNLYVPEAPPRQNDFYDYNGNLICSESYSQSCSYFSNSKLNIIRRIWQEK